MRFEIVTAHSRAGVRLVAAGDVDLAVVTGQAATPAQGNPNLTPAPAGQKGQFDINIADPRFRDELLSQAGKLGYL